MNCESDSNHSALHLPTQQPTTWRPDGTLAKKEAVGGGRRVGAREEGRGGGAEHTTVPQK